jgi:hypothetical protein
MADPATGLVGVDCCRNGAGNRCNRVGAKAQTACHQAQAPRSSLIPDSKKLNYSESLFCLDFHAARDNPI